MLQEIRERRSPDEHAMRPGHDRIAVADVKPGELGIKRRVGLANQSFVIAGGDVEKPEALIVALYLNRRQRPFTALNSWTGSLSTASKSGMELHLNRRQPRVRVCRLSGESPKRRLKRWPSAD